MNCKPNDLAMLVRADDNPHVAPFLGRIVRVTTPIRNRHGEDCWCYEGEPLFLPEANHFMECIPDVMLKPLRDPGDDAVDEMLTLGPKVSTAVTDSYHETLSARDRQLWERAWDEAMGVR